MHLVNADGFRGAAYCPNVYCGLEREAQLLYDENKAFLRRKL